MIIDNTTYEAVRSLSVRSGISAFLVIFPYLCFREDEPITYSEIQKSTGLSYKVMKYVIDCLEKVNIIKQTNLKSRKKKFEILDFHGDFDLARILLLNSDNSIVHTEGSESIKYIERRRRRRPPARPRAREGYSQKFNISDVESDSDWKEIEEILLQYYKPGIIHPRSLVGEKQYFSRLCTVWENLGRKKFDAYAKWYRINIYPNKKFNYGLFLYPGVIAQFEESQDEDIEDQRYMNTGALRNSEKFKTAVEKSRNDIKGIIGESNG